MLGSLRQRARGSVNVTFPERQVFIRSEGRLQIYTVSSDLQALVAGAGVLLLSWMGFTTVNVIFKDRVLAAQEHQMEQMRIAYEKRIGDLQLSYDELNGAVVLAQDRFKSIVDSFETKQQTLAALIEQKKSLRASLGIGVPGNGPATGTASRSVVRASQKPRPSARPVSRRAALPGVGGNFTAIGPGQTVVPVPPFAPTAAMLAAPQSLSPEAPRNSVVPPAPQTNSAVERRSFFEGAVQSLGTFFQHKAATGNLDHPLLKEVATQSARMLLLEQAQPVLLAEATEDLDAEAARLGRALKATGIDTKGLMSRVSAVEGQTPLVATGPADLVSRGDGFAAGMDEASAAMQKLASVVATLNAVPLAAPIDQGYVSSGFGSRVDPFNERLAFHSGVDFSGPYGSDVRVTAPGVVVFAGRNGALGNMIEVDHGYGVRTRYGHLSKILATTGNHLEKGALLGRLGSTGRSTGPHVHYEVWYDNTVADPNRFIRAGQNVLEE